MLHEVLFALAGHTGDIIVKDKSGAFRVAEDVDFIEENERTVLDNLVAMGGRYAQLLSFVKSYRHQSLRESKSTGQGNGVVEGLYVAAMCQGIDVLLQQYRQDVVAAEQAILRQPAFPLASLTERLSSHMTLLKTLQDITATVTDKGLKGGALISHLSQKSLSGVPVIRDCAKSLLAACYRVFYQQLSEWCIHGLLRDPYHEFMVTRVSTPPTPFEIGSGVPGVEVVAAENAWLSEFRVDVSMLPDSIPLRVAEKILFIGKAQMILTDNVRLNEFVTRQEGKEGRSSGISGISGISNTRHSVAHMDPSELVAEIAMLGAMAAFQPGTFEAAIDRIRGIVSKALWTMFVISADLGEQLRALKDYFLLGRGDFYQVFLEESRTLMSAPPESNAKHEVAFLFQQACTKSTSDSDPLFKLFKISLPSMTATDSDNKDPWRDMSLQYEVQWPLHLLFHDTVMSQYNTLFSFLIHVKRVQTEVHTMWLLQQRCKGLSTAERARFAPIWRQREQMAFVIDNLQHYLCDVLEVQYQQLKDRIQVSTDFETLRKAHEEYVSVLLRDCCFIHTPVISRALEEIFRLSARFCSLWKRVDAHDPGADLHGPEMDEISTAFRRQSSLLFTYLSHQTSRYLGQLLLRLDYNRHFTRTCLSASNK